ncbi:MAG: hypothetical protein KatS3mg076_0857 [Candidatus Binatia bacterium]|nr:MAG: hypothetical protein KatS3mg076_0857 [Candidatus Binatia bacterium]
MKRTLGVLIFFGALAVPSWGGVMDSPLPELVPGSSTQHVYTVPGVVKNNNLETVFICTNLERTKTVRVAVEVFPIGGGPPLNDVSTGVGDGAEDVPVGATVTIATGSTAGLHETEVIGSLGPASVKNGSARILSTSKRIACEAFAVDQLGDPPVVMVPLKMISRRQKGD